MTRVSDRPLRHFRASSTHVELRLNFLLTLGHLLLKLLCRIDGQMENHCVRKLAQHPVLVFRSEQSLELVIDVIWW